MAQSTGQGLADGREDARLSAEVIAEDQVERLPGLRLVVAVPPGIVPAAAAGDLLGAQPEFFLPLVW
jgi:hypothetical protein